MIPEEALQIVLTKLEGYGIPYMITGSFAANMHGVPRATQDADVIIAVDQQSLGRFIKSLGEQFYVSLEAAYEALERQRIFNVVHLETGFKVDLIIRKSRPFSQVEFSRRQQANFLGRPRWFASAEDTILAKLEWARTGSSQRQFSDALSVAKVQGKNLDWEYMQKWARELEVQDLLKKLLGEID